jgi:cobalt/nickel transport system permease protein
VHIPDAYLSPATHAVAGGVMLPIWAIALRRTARHLTTRQVPLLSLGAAFCFVIQMFNVPAVGGTTAHATGATLLAILLGPWAALLAVTLTLAIQAIFFGDGGVLAISANAFNMGLVATFVGYGTYRLLSAGAPMGAGRTLLAAAAGAYLASVLSAVSTGVWLGVQPLVAQDAAGRALYFPFGAHISVPAMAHIHLLVAAPVEAVVTITALAYLWRNFPELTDRRRVMRPDKPIRLWFVFLLLLLLTPLGLLATGAAWGEWDEETLRRLIGYVPAGIARFGEGLLKPLLPDYTLPGREGKVWEVLAYLLSAGIGVLFTGWVARRLVRKPTPVPADVVGEARPLETLPDWLVAQEPTPKDSLPARAQGRWLERTLLQLREVVAAVVAEEEWSRQPGYLQRLHPVAKTLVALLGLVVLSLSRHPLPPSLILLASWLLAWRSLLPVGRFITRVALAVALFGVLIALPLSLQAVTPGHVIWQPGTFSALAVSREGIEAAGLLLLRLAAAVSVALLWSFTTPWHLLLRSLRVLRVPRLLVSGLLMTYRYLFTLVDVLTEMILARRSRQSGTVTRQQARGYAGVGAAVLFAKSAALQEEVFSAMRSRGFDDDLRISFPRRWHWRDTLWLLVAGACVVGVYWFGGGYGG